MALTFSEALATALQTTKTSLRQIAEKADVSYEQLKKVKQGKTQSTNVDDAQRVAVALGLTLDQFLSGDFDRSPTIPIAAEVGDGALVPSFDLESVDGLPQVECPPQLSPRNLFAIRVSGNSMEPVYSGGDLLFFYNKRPGEVPYYAMDKRCLCVDESGQGWIKQVRTGISPDRYNLSALTPSSSNVHDIKLSWAQPMRLHLPYELSKITYRGKYR